MKFYIIKQNSLWGDYGSILAHGMAAHLPRRDGLLRLERTAPFVSPLTLPGLGAIVVTQAAHERMERREIPGVSFLPVLKARIVEYHWEHWDRSLAAPVEYPEGGEPEGYILDRPHSPAFAEQLPEFWEVTLPQDASLKSVRVGRGAYDYFLDPSEWKGSPLFHPTGKLHILATEELKPFLEEIGGEWITFQEVTLTT